MITTTTTIILYWKNQIVYSTHYQHFLPQPYDSRILNQNFGFPFLTHSFIFFERFGSVMCMRIRNTSNSGFFFFTFFDQKRRMIEWVCMVFFCVCICECVYAMVSEWNRMLKEIEIEEKTDQKNNREKNELFFSLSLSLSLAFDTWMNHWFILCCLSVSLCMFYIQFLFFFSIIMNIKWMKMSKKKKLYLDTHTFIYNFGDQKTKRKEKTFSFLFVFFH